MQLFHTLALFATLAGVASAKDDSWRTYRSDAANSGVFNSYIVATTRGTTNDTLPSTLVGGIVLTSSDFVGGQVCGNYAFRMTDAHSLCLGFRWPYLPTATPLPLPPRQICPSASGPLL